MMRNKSEREQEGADFEVKMFEIYAMRPIEKRARRTDDDKKLNGDDDVSFWHQMSRTRTVSEPFEVDSAVVASRLRMPSLNLNLNSGGVGEERRGR